MLFFLAIFQYSSIARRRCSIGGTAHCGRRNDWITDNAFTIAVGHINSTDGSMRFNNSLRMRNLFSCCSCLQGLPCCNGVFHSETVRHFPS